jgi:AAA domain
VSAKPIEYDEPLDAGPADDEIDDPSRGVDAFLYLATLDGRSNGNAPAGSFVDRVISRRVDLLARIREGIPDAVYLPASFGMLRAGKRHHMPAPKKVGKSIAALTHAVDMALAGARVIIFDRENGGDLFAERLDQIITARGLDDDAQAQLASRIVYYEFPRFRDTDEQDLVALCSGADLVIFDSQRMFLSDLGLEESGNDDYADFMAALIDPLFRAGIATLVLDNAGHQEPKRGRGASAKGDLNEINFSLETVEPFNLDTTGRVRLEIENSRFGNSGRWELEIGGGVFGSWHRIDDGIDDTPLGFRPTALMERASIFIENCTDSPTRRTITDEIGGKGRYARIAIDVLVREGYARGAKGQGVESIKPYRQADDPAVEVGRNG